MERIFIRKKYLETNNISALNKPLLIDMPFNKLTKQLRK